MTFETYDTSIDQGAPVYLVDFFVGTTHWRYTSADRPITFQSFVFSPVALTVGNVNQGPEIKKKTLPITLPQDAAVVLRLQGYPPSSDIGVIVNMVHLTDPDLQGAVPFVGRIMSQSQVGTTVTVSCEPASTGVQSTGLRMRWMINCPHVLYRSGCNLVAAAFGVPSIVTAVAGPVITCAGLVPPGLLQWPGGYVAWDSGDGYEETRSINAAAGAVLTLSYPASDLIVGTPLIAYPGCKHTTDDCAKFGAGPRGNLDNYGGAPWIPGINPMAGNPIY
jgi:hypothetical protein